MQEREKQDNWRRSGRPRTTTAVENGFITTTAKRDRRYTAPDITQHNRTRIVVTTVSKRLLTTGINRRVVIKNILERVRKHHK